MKAVEICASSPSNQPSPVEGEFNRRALLFSGFQRLRGNDVLRGFCAGMTHPGVRGRRDTMLRAANTCALIVIASKYAMGR